MLLFSERSEKVTFKTFHEQWIHNVYDVLNIIKDQIALNGRIILTLLESVHITLRERSLLVGNGITVIISVGHVTLKMPLVIVTSYFSQIVIELHHYKSN